MNRLAIAMVIFAAGCPSSQKAAAPNPAIYAKKISLSWGIQQAAAAADVFFQTTDETGKQVSYPIGNFKGQCKVIRPAPEMAALTGVGCDEGASGTELHAIVRGDEVIIVKLHTDSGVKPDPMAREEVTRVTAPSGAKIEVGT
jgi:hypothetical protein